MTSAVAILERLLDDQAQNSKEHVMETASPHLSNVEDRMDKTFDSMVKEISEAFGVPDFANSRPTGEEKMQSVLPKWSDGTPKSGGSPKTMRLSYWKRPEGTFYIVLRTEFDPKKERNVHYDLSLGARRKSPEATPRVDRLRNTKEHWFNKVLPFFTGR